MLSKTLVEAILLNVGAHDGVATSLFISNFLKPAGYFIHRTLHLGKIYSVKAFSKKFDSIL